MDVQDVIDRLSGTLRFGSPRFHEIKKGIALYRGPLKRKVGAYYESPSMPLKPSQPYWREYEQHFAATPKN